MRVVVSVLVVFVLGGAGWSIDASRRRSLPVFAAGTVVSRPFLLGRSEEGRPIVAVRVGDPHGTRVLVVGCIHGTECAGLAVARALERVHAQVDLWIVPDLNPDGYARGTRQNGRGVETTSAATRR
jgi:protein MpaA